jgi:4-hydroxythreonine-4-phosphate dehydrogenase|tara:strand:+ start:20056 stop:20928 length:873 start_codon:yes stop_codon:yes gene_type:complete
LDVNLSLAQVSSAAEGFELNFQAGFPVLELETPPSDDSPGGPTASFGMAAVEAVLRAGTLCLTGKADGMVTPPLSKESMHKAGYSFEGQTQIIGELCNSRRYGMLACNGNLKVLLATRHIALREVIERLEIGSVAKQIRIAHEAARGPLGLEKPRIALAGLNPHAGENGAFGNEERKVLKPAIARAKKEFGFQTAGPEVPDVVFADAVAGKWDVVVALYHDQGFIPLKFMGRKEAWTLFVGGDILRTSPMHGTAWDIARTGSADFKPFAHALERCIELAKGRISAPCSST